MMTTPSQKVTSNPTKSKEKKLSIYAINYWNALYSEKLGVSADEFHETIVSISNDWWHYLPDMYLVATTRKSLWLVKQIIKKHPKLSFMVHEPSKITGKLAKSSWEWINKYKREYSK